MFHEWCMVRIRDDIFQCKVCREAGVPLEDEVDDDVSDEGEDEDDVDCDDHTSDEDHEDKESHLHTTVREFGILKLGMACRGGRVSELWPGIDRCMVEFRTSSGAVGIKRLSLAKVLQKATEDARSELDVMD